MKTRIIHTKVWKDPWFVKLSCDAKMLWLYLLTNEKINICATYEISEREINFDTGIPSHNISKVKEELYPKALFVDDWVFVVNAKKYNSYVNGPKNEVAFKREVGYIPESVLLKLKEFKDTSINTSMDTRQKQENKKHNLEILKQKEEREDIPF